MKTLGILSFVGLHIKTACSLHFHHHHHYYHHSNSSLSPLSLLFFYHLPESILKPSQPPWKQDTIHHTPRLSITATFLSSHHAFPIFFHHSPSHIQPFSRCPPHSSPISRPCSPRSRTNHSKCLLGYHLQTCSPHSRPYHETTTRSPTTSSNRRSSNISRPRNVKD